MTLIPAPKTSVSSVRYGCRYRRYRYRLSYRYHTLGQVRYNIDTGTGHFRKFSTASVPVPDTSEIRYDINTSSGHFSASSVRHQYVLPVPERYLHRRACRYRHNIDPRYRTLRYVRCKITRYRTVRYIRYDINPVPPHCDIKIRLAFFDPIPSVRCLLFDLKQ